MQTAFDLVRYSSLRTPSHPALVDDVTGRRFTYAELIEEIEAAAAGFLARGVKPGTRVATVLGNQLEHGIALLALGRIGAVPALLNARLAPADIAKLIEQGEIKGAVILPSDELAAAVKAALPEGAPLLSVGKAVPGAEDFAKCRGDAATLPPPPKPGREDEAFIFYTSGTTGLPKGVVIPHKATEHRVIWLATQGGLRHGGHTNTLGFMPLSHAIGFYGVFLVTLAFGGTVWNQTAFDPAKAVDIIEKGGVTYMFAVPTLYHAITQAPNYDPKKMKSLELVLWGGGNIEPGLYDKLTREWPCLLRHIYGTTETMSSGYNPEPTPDRLTTLRSGFYNTHRVIALGGGVDDLVPEGEEGELIVGAGFDTIFTGYLNRPDATAEKLRDGWYFTGDVVVNEPGGYFTLMGRVDDMIRSGGESIHPEEVEAVLDEAPGVAEVSVIGVPDPKWGQIVVACVVREKGATAGAEDLEKHCLASSLAPYKRPRAYVFYDAPLPRNAANKVLRRILRADAEAARDSSGDKVLETVKSAK